MRRVFRWTAALAVTLALAVVLAASGVLYFAQRALPPLEGTVVAKGLLANAEVARDAAGIPHISAGNPYDLFFAQGYVTAQDRLWQLEFNRRLVRGRLSEVFGPLTVEPDRLFRTLGLARAAAADWAALDAESRLAMQAYADGVNAFVAATPALPAEFSLLVLSFEPWQPTDSLAWSKMMAWQLSGNLGAELLRAELVGRFGPEAAARLMPSLPPGVVPVTTPGLQYEGMGASLRKQLDRVFNLVRPRSEELGSNNWVVAGARTVTGKPLLANDTHLGLQLPSPWYAVHLKGTGVDVIGFSLPGTPGVIIGHNQRIAWGVTNTYADVQDLFVERRHPERRDHYLYAGQWEPATVVHEEIAVRGWVQPVRLEVHYTRHGPVLNGDAEGEDPLALQWTAFRSARLPAAVLALGKAQNWAEFRAALRDFDVPAQNFVYADVDGNVGFQLAGLVPVRQQGDGLLPAPGWTGDHEWTGYLRFDELPSALNPTEGYFATANDRVVPDDYPYLVTHEWAPSFRVERAKQLLAGNPGADRSAMMAMQLDLRSAFAEALVPYLLAAGGRGLAEEWAGAGMGVPSALATLQGWDFVLAAESPAATVYAVVYERLVRNVFADELGAELFPYYDSSSRSHMLATVDMLRRADEPWFDDVGTPAREDRDAILWRSLVEAAGALQRRFGPDPARWRWGDLHSVTFAHPLGQVPLLDRLFNRGPFLRGGDATTLNVAGYSFLAPYRESHHAAMRMVLDLSDWDQSLAVLTLGQSGQPLSRHYDDHLPLWLAGRYLPLPYSDAAVAAAAVARLQLAPR